MFAKVHRKRFSILFLLFSISTHFSIAFRFDFSLLNCVELKSLNHPLHAFSARIDGISDQIDIDGEEFENCIISRE